MSRLRKTSARWQEREREASSRVMVVCDGPVFTIDLHGLFPRDAPVELEIGAGRGDFIIDRAAAFPDRNFLAVELARSIAQMMAVRAAQRGLANLRLVRMDARPLVNLMLPDRCLAACHIYFPDPWPKRHHIKHRLFTLPFVRSLSRKLAAGAPLFIATDVNHYADSIFAMVEAAGMNRLEAVVPGADGTVFARKFLAAGLPVYARAYAAPA